MMLGDVKDGSVFSQIGVSSGDSEFIAVGTKMSDDEHLFSITAERVQEMTKIVRFLEQQKHDVKEIVDKHIEEERVRNDMLIQGKVIKM